LEGWLLASKGLGPLLRRRGSALAHGCGRGGRAALPLPRAAAVSAGVRAPLACHRTGCLARPCSMLRLAGVRGQGSEARAQGLG
jgi:hypothetical protein